MNPRELAELLAGPRTGGAAGRAQAYLRFEQLTHRQRQLLKSWPGGETTKPGPSYQHPARAAKSMGPPDTPGRLGGADLVWLQRLPSDPAEVTFADAVTLASLAGHVETRTADRRLLDAVWEPVKLVHDLRQAEADLTAATARVVPRADQSADAVNAVADAVLEQTPNLTRGEATGRAAALLSEIAGRLLADRDAAIDAAKERIGRAKAEIAARARVTAA